MKLLVSGSTVSVARFHAQRPDRIGALFTPRTGNAIASAVGMTWAADNDCFNGLDRPAFLRFLARIVEAPTRPAWVACPDVVADMGATWSSFYRWEPVLTDLGLPIALVLQDGIERLKWRAPFPSALSRIAAVFVGGSTEWKLSDAAIEFCRAAKAEGKLVHVGRVNSLRRILYFARRARDAGIEVDTIDGSGFSRYGDARIPKAIRWIDKSIGCRQTVAFGGQA